MGKRLQKKSPLLVAGHEKKGHTYIHQDISKFEVGTLAVKLLQYYDVMGDIFSNSKQEHSNQTSS